MDRSTPLRELTYSKMKSKDTIMWSQIWLALWRRGMCVKRVRKRAEVTCHTSVTRRMARPPCAFSDVRIQCAECNRHFSSCACFDNNKQITTKRNSVCEIRRDSVTCEVLMTMIGTNVPNVSFICKQNRMAGHMCYMNPLKKVLPANSDKVLYVFYNFEAFQNTR